MPYIRVIKYSYTDCTRTADPDEEYDGDDYQTSHDVTGFKVVKKSECYDGSVSFTPKKRVRYYLVHVIYDTGDSFSQDNGKFEFIGLYESKAFAQNIKNKIIEHNELLKDTYDDLPIHLTTEDGKEYQFTVPWQGYFEHFVSVEINEVQLQK